MADHLPITTVHLPYLPIDHMLPNPVTLVSWLCRSVGDQSLSGSTDHGWRCARLSCIGIAVSEGLIWPAKSLLPMAIPKKELLQPDYCVGSQWPQLGKNIPLPVREANHTAEGLCWAIALISASLADYRRPGSKSWLWDL